MLLAISSWQFAHCNLLPAICSIAPPTQGNRIIHHNRMDAYKLASKTLSCQMEFLDCAPDFQRQYGHAIRSFIIWCSWVDAHFTQEMNLSHWNSTSGRRKTRANDRDQSNHPTGPNQLSTAANISFQRDPKPRIGTYFHSWMPPQEGWRIFSFPRVLIINFLSTSTCSVLGTQTLSHFGSGYTRTATTRLSGLVAR